MGAAQPWKRRIEIGDCVLYEGDCLEVMPSLGGGHRCRRHGPALWNRFRIKAYKMVRKSRHQTGYMG